MAESLAIQLASQRYASVVAPAGCGKTYLISEAVSHTDGCQLVLTHSHAGKSAITTRMREMRVPVHRYCVATLDSFALNYVRAFPTIGEVAAESLESFDWPAIRRASARALENTSVQNVVRATYAGIFVDEYQDCDKPQHELVVSLARLLPCRILGDPLQAVFKPLHKEEALSWQDAVKVFPQIGTLSTPQRWKHRNPGLGEWLLYVRLGVERGERVPLRNHGVPGLSVIQTSDYVRKLTECYKMLDHAEGRVVILRRFPNECHALASRLKNRCAVFEDVQLGELEQPAREIFRFAGFDRTKAVIHFAHRWLANLPGPVRTAGERLLDGKDPRTKDPQALAVIAGLRQVAASNKFLAVDETLAKYEACKPTFKSFEVWRGLRKAIQAYDPSEKVTLLQTVQRQRDTLRRLGRKLPTRSIATPLLVKGLECEHALIFDLDTIESNESLYVSLTRASTTLTLLTEKDCIAPFV
jgi:DNA helicase-2/ATP-dependent DNA helicase PcrA